MIEKSKDCKQWKFGCEVLNRNVLNDYPFGGLTTIGVRPQFTIKRWVKFP